MSSAESSSPVVFLMRGLPSAGKSHTARALAGEHGVVCETDEYFYTQVGDDPTRYDYDRERLVRARRWNLGRFKRAVDARRTPIVVDRGNGLSAATAVYARYAHRNGYRIELREPDSEWWQEIRVLLKYRHLTRPALMQWADLLARINASTHRASAASIYRRMEGWKNDLSVEEILAFREEAGGEPDAHGASVHDLRRSGTGGEGPAATRWGSQWLRIDADAGQRSRPGPEAVRVEWDA